MFDVQGQPYNLAAFEARFVKQNDIQPGGLGSSTEVADGVRLLPTAADSRVRDGGRVT